MKAYVLARERFGRRSLLYVWDEYRSIGRARAAARRLAIAHPLYEFKVAIEDGQQEKVRNLQTASRKREMLPPGENAEEAPS